MSWKDKAIKMLEDSLIPVPSELNGLYWKGGLSNKTDRLAQHICAFANHKGGGLLVFGVNDDATFKSLSKEEIEETVKKLGNIAKNNLSEAITIDHTVLDYNGYALLFVHIPEQTDKPIHLKGKDIYQAYHRSAGHTEKMSRQQVKSMIADSQGRPFEKRIARENVSTEELLTLLNYRKLYELQERKIPVDTTLVAEHLADCGFCIRSGEAWNITNMGAILFAQDLTMFDSLAGHTFVVRKYVGTNNREMLSEQKGRSGYAVGFEELVDYVMKLTSTEKIDVMRESVPTYPRVAIREFIANALIHQDFSAEGMQVIVEIFSNRMTITNPGPPLNDINRLIDLPPHSRNEKLAEALFLLGICERRGSGVDRAIEAIEEMGLPAPKFSKSEVHTRVALFPQKLLKEMTKQEKIDACYQHACLVYEDGKSVNNQSVRERFRLGKNDSPVASRIIADTVESGLLKQEDENTTSRKYVTYIPYYG